MDQLRRQESAAAPAPTGRDPAVVVLYYDEGLRCEWYMPLSIIVFLTDGTLSQDGRKPEEIMGRGCRGIRSTPYRWVG
jgi:hypothetical protein